MDDSNFLKTLISYSKEYGFVYRSSEVYDGLSAVYDYGPNGVELKNNIKQYWWRSMVDLNSNIVGLDSAIFMHPNVWVASGHVDQFNDFLIDNKDSKKRYRVDTLIEDFANKIDIKIQKELQKAKKRFKDDFSEDNFLKTNKKVIEYKNKQSYIIDSLNKAMDLEDTSMLDRLVSQLGINCPHCGNSNWSKVRKFNLIFSTKLGSVEDKANDLYLRPETAQGIFINFLNVQKSMRKKLPFGIAQVGKAFRNEIVARQFIFRMREFEQMEMQFFIKPDTYKEWFEYWKEKRLRWHLSLGLGEDKYRFKDHDNLSHYSNAATDIEFDFPFGFKELEGIHSRTDFDLMAHQQLSNKKMQYFDSNTNKSYVPYVIETSIGLDRLFLSVLSSCFKIEKLKDSTERKLLSLPFFLSPIKLAIMPLEKKANLVEKSKKIEDNLKYLFPTYYDDKDSIGKRYRRQDAWGTPFCMTLDYEGLENDTVTIRDRDTMEQVRIKINQIPDFINNKIKLEEFMKKI